MHADALWKWVDQLERYAEAGLHARGFAHELSNALTALQGNCELALIGENVGGVKGDIERILELARRVNARLSNFKEFLAPVGDPQPPMKLSDAVREAEMYLSHVLRKVSPKAGGVPSLEKHLQADGLIAVPPARLVHALVAAIHVYLENAGRFLGPLVVTSGREGERIVLDFDLQAGVEPRTGEETWKATTSGLSLQVAQRNLEEAGGSLSRDASGAVRLVLPLAEERRRLPDRDAQPWSFHG
jgi:C4-dicarboxylate-specific signal transduction histidine kinase